MKGTLCDLTNLDVDFVSTKDNGDIFADTLKITVPVGNVLVGDSGSDIEHDDTTLALDVVSITETTKLLLSSGIPDVEADGAEVGREGEGMYFHAKSGCGAKG